MQDDVNRQETPVPTTQLALPSLDALRAQFDAASHEDGSETPETPAAAPAPGFRRGQQAAAATAPEKPKGREPRPNTYGGDCVNCGRRVEASLGLLGEKVDGKWTVKHIECPVVEETPAEPEPVAKDGEQPVKVDPRNPAPGLYTVEDAQGHVTLWVWQQQMDDDFAPGELIVKFFFGRDNTDKDSYTGFGFIKGGRLIVWKKHRTEGDEKRYVKAARVLLDDPSKVLVAKTCVRCHDVLTNPASIDAGIGPYCRKVWSW